MGKISDLIDTLTFKHQPHKMAKETQTIRGKIDGELFECVWTFYGLARKGLTYLGNCFWGIGK